MPPATSSKKKKKRRRRWRGREDERGGRREEEKEDCDEEATRREERRGEDRRGFRLQTRRVGVGLKITVTAEPVLVVVVVVYIVHVAFTAVAAVAAAAAGSYLRPLKLDDDIDDATASLRHSLELAIHALRVGQHFGTEPRDFLHENRLLISTR